MTCQVTCSECGGTNVLGEPIDGIAQLLKGYCWDCGKQVDVALSVLCPNCGGKGWLRRTQIRFYEDELVPCGFCKGSGEIRE